MENEMDAELRFHIETFAEDLVRGGVSREEALRRARIEFGGQERFKEECREAVGAHFLETFLQDSRYGLRMLSKNPGFTAATVLTLALGIASTSVLFSILDGSQYSASFIRIRKFALTPHTSKVRAVCAKERTHGSARGVAGDRHPYRHFFVLSRNVA
jgi:hypothetical protein